MKWLFPLIAIWASAAIAGETSKSGQVTAEAVTEADHKCLPLRTPGIAESSDSYGKYVDRRCSRPVQSADTDEQVR